MIKWILKRFFPKVYDGIYEEGYKTAIKDAKEVVLKMKDGK